MLKPTPQALAAAANALYRIRAVEGPPDPDGRKTVWHQCALGAELISQVDVRGHVFRQELTLIRGYFVWSSDRGVATGQVIEDGPMVNLDAQASPDRLSEALEAFSGYSGEDRYIQHFLKVLGLARDGMPTDDEDSVTSVAPVDAAGRGRTARRWLYAAAALAALGAAAAAVLR